MINILKCGFVLFITSLFIASGVAFAMPDSDFNKLSNATIDAMLKENTKKYCPGDQVARKGGLELIGIDIWNKTAKATPTGSMQAIGCQAVKAGKIADLYVTKDDKRVFPVIAEVSQMGDGKGGRIYYWNFKFSRSHRSLINANYYLLIGIISLDDKAPVKIWLVPDTTLEMYNTWGGSLKDPAGKPHDHKNYDYLAVKIKDVPGWLKSFEIKV
jgi:hypothetical protein